MKTLFPAIVIDRNRRLATAQISGGGEGGGGAAVWGGITGNPADQADMMALFNAKQPLDSDLTAIAALDDEWPSAAVRC